MNAPYPVLLYFDVPPEVNVVILVTHRTSMFETYCGYLCTACRNVCLFVLCYTFVLFSNGL